MFKWNKKASPKQLPRVVIRDGSVVRNRFTRITAYAYGAIATRRYGQTYLTRIRLIFGYNRNIPATFF